MTMGPRYVRNAERRSTAGARPDPRETDVFRLLATGLTAHAVVRQLGIREATVRKHLERAYAKLGSRDRLGAVQLARQNGLPDRLQPA